MQVAVIVISIYLALGFIFWLVSRLVKFILEFSFIFAILAAFGVKSKPQTTGEKWAEFFLIVFLWLPYGIYSAFQK